MRCRVVFPRVGGAWGLAVTSLLAVALGGCAGPRFRPADPHRPNTIIGCTGVFEKMVVGEECIGIHLRPTSKSGHLLTRGRDVIVCEIVPPARRATFDSALKKLVKGMEVEVWGYFVFDEQTGANKIRPVTAVDPYP